MDTPKIILPNTHCCYHIVSLCTVRGGGLTRASERVGGGGQRNWRLDGSGRICHHWSSSLVASVGKKMPSGGVGIIQRQIY